MPENIIPLRQRLFAIATSNRRKIYKLCLKERLNISQIAVKIKLSYKSTFQNIDILERAGLVTKEKETTEKSNESFIKSVPMDNPDSIVTKVFNDLEKSEAKK